MRFRFLVVTTFVLTFTTLGMSVAHAAPPSNDDFANATTVTEPLPFTDSVDTTEATVEATDPACDGDFGPQNTVWYAYTPSTSGFFQANTFGSDYDTTLWVGTGSAGNFADVGCNDDTSGGTTGVESKVVWDATASTTYYIMAGTCCGGGNSGGNLVLTVDTSAAPFTIDDLSISGRGKVTPKTGEAVISGSITCSNGPGFVELDIDVSQRIGRAIVHGEGFDEFECSGTQSWSLTVVPFDGLFVAGRAHVEAFAFGPDDSFFFTDATVRLRGH